MTDKRVEEAHDKICFPCCPQGSPCHILSILKRMIARDEIPDPPGDQIAISFPNNPDHENLRRRAAEWIRDNPEAYDRLAERCFGMIGMGAHRLSIYRLMEELRDEPIDMKRDKRGFKLNNNHRPYVARQLVADYPELGKYFKFRSTVY